MFTEADRARIRAELIAFAQDDPRVIAGAEVGSLAAGTGDRWSDLDLTFALRQGESVAAVADDWTARLAAAAGAAHLFDLPVGPILYRVFLFPGALQVDLSWTPDAIAKRGPRFRLLFGTAVEEGQPTPADPRQILGLAVHHALRARLAIERGRPWAAAWAIEGLRNEALSLASLQRGLPERFARSTDALPAELLDRAAPSLVRSLDRAELLRALVAGIELLLDVAAPLLEATPQVVTDLRGLRAAELE